MPMRSRPPPSWPTPRVRRSTWPHRPLAESSSLMRRLEPSPAPFPSAEPVGAGLVRGRQVPLRHRRRPRRSVVRHRYGDETAASFHLGGPHAPVARAQSAWRHIVLVRAIHQQDRRDRPGTTSDRNQNPGKATARCLQPDTGRCPALGGQPPARRRRQSGCGFRGGRSHRYGRTKGGRVDPAAERFVESARAMRIARRPACLCDPRVESLHDAPDPAGARLDEHQRGEHHRRCRPQIAHYGAAG